MKITARKMTAGDVVKIIPVIDRIQELKDSKDAFALARILPEALDAVSAVSQHPRSKLDDLPLHEAISVIGQALDQWLAINGPYMAEEVAPAVQKLGNALSGLALAVKQK